MRDSSRLRHWLHMPGSAVRALRYFWSSDVNRAAVARLDPIPGERVLDLGSGFGPATVEAAKRLGPTGRVVAVDPSRTMRLVLGARRWWQLRRGAIDVRPGTAESLPLPDSSIDAALSLNVMHHLSDLGSATQELARVLKPGGRVLLIDEAFDDPAHLFHHEGGEEHHTIDFVDPHEVVASLKSAGLSEVTSDHEFVGGQPAYVVVGARLWS